MRLIIYELWAALNYYSCTIFKRNVSVQRDIIERVPEGQINLINTMLRKLFLVTWFHTDIGNSKFVLLLTLKDDLITAWYA